MTADASPFSFDNMPPDLAHVLRYHSPRVVIRDSVLIPHPSSPTGWLLVVPEAADDR